MCCGVWTADSKYFLFLNDLKEYWAIPDRQFPLSPPEPVLLSSVGLPIAAAATSPLEKVIFVAASARVADVLSLNVKTGETSSLYPELNPVRVSFSRDGKFVAYYLQDVRGGQLWRARADGTDKLPTDTTAYAALHGAVLARQQANRVHGPMAAATLEDLLGSKRRGRNPRDSIKSAE